VLAVGALVLVTVGCGGAVAVTAPAAEEKVPRRPDAVALDPAPALPAAAIRGPARGVVALREPAAEDAVNDLVQGFLDGWERGSLDALLALTALDAGLIDGPEHGHAALVESWRQRLRAHDYSRLAGAEVVRRERIERWEWDELGTPATPTRPAGMRPGEILVRAPLEITRIAGERVFGDVVTMVLRRQDGRLRIAAYGEGDAP
jgi:hypothetical protein